MPNCDVVIIGAGPYGLCAASHLRTIQGLEVRVFGEPMSFWASMPSQMLLRSNWTATQMPDPKHELTLEAFQEATHQCVTVPVPLEKFIEYGRWYQRQAVPDVDSRTIQRVEKAQSHFQVTTADGEAIRAQRVVIAAGIASFARKPAMYNNLPEELASHTSKHRDFRSFAGKEVLVVGGGQSALESAALLYEAGAEVEVICRAPRIHWLQGFASKTLHHRLGPLVRRLLYAPTDVGPALISQLCARPELLQQLPRAVQDRIRKRATRPAGARWLVDRLANSKIRLQHTVASAVPVGGRVRVRLDDNSERVVDHILLGTGYQIDISKYDFLAPGLVESIRRVDGSPQLRSGLETSVDGLHILGAPAAWTFGPVMQFVSGANWATKALLRKVAGDNGRARTVSKTEYDKFVSASSISDGRQPTNNVTPVR